MTWSACDRALMDVNFHSRRLGWERFEEILVRVRRKIEAWRCCRIHMGEESRIIPRVMRLWKRLRREIYNLGNGRDPDLSALFFQDLEMSIRFWLCDALEYGHGH